MTKTIAFDIIVSSKKGETKMTRGQIEKIEKQLSKKRRSYNKCTDFARRAKLDYEIGCLYEELAQAYKNLKEN